MLSLQRGTEFYNQTPTLVPGFTQSTTPGSIQKDGQSLESFSSLSAIQTGIFVLFVFRAFIAIVGFFANCLVVFCVCYFKKLRKVNNFFVANLAIIDALTLAVDLTIFLPCNIPPPYKKHSLRFLNCQIASFGNTLTAMSLIALILISVDRFIFIIMPLMYEKFRRNWLKIIVFFCWIVCGGLYTLFGMTLMCPKGSATETTYNLINLFYFIIWFIVVSVLYSVIFKTAHRQNQAIRRNIMMTQRASVAGKPPNMAGDVNGDASMTPNFSQTQIRIIVGYALIVGIAFVTFLFIEALEVSFLINSDPGSFSEVPFLLVEIARTQLTMNSVINPFIYGATQKVYRDAFFSTAKCQITKSAIKRSAIYDNDTLKLDVDV